MKPTVCYLNVYKLLLVLPKPRWQVRIKIQLCSLIFRRVHGLIHCSRLSALFSASPFHISSATTALGNSLFFTYAIDFWFFTFIQVVPSTLQFSPPHLCLKVCYPSQKQTLVCASHNLTREMTR